MKPTNQPHIYHPQGCLMDLFSFQTSCRGLSRASEGRKDPVSTNFRAWYLICWRECGVKYSMMDTSSHFLLSKANGIPNDLPPIWSATACSVHFLPSFCCAPVRLSEGSSLGMLPWPPKISRLGLNNGFLLSWWRSDPEAVSLGSRVLTAVSNLRNLLDLCFPVRVLQGLVPFNYQLDLRLCENVRFGNCLTLFHLETKGSRWSWQQ